MDKPTVGEVEQRSTTDNGIEFSGNHVYGVVPVGRLSNDFGGWNEVIEPGALDRTDISALVATVEHDAVSVLGRYDTTLKVENRTDGLAWSVELPDSPLGQNVKASVARGDFPGGSWQMVVSKDRWDGNTRHIEEIAELRDVTVCARPAYGYEAAPVELRSLFGAKEERAPMHENGAVTTPTPAPVEGAPDDAQEAHMDKNKETGGGLKIESRTAPENELTVESRIYAAMRNVRKGESRDLTRASAEPIEPVDIQHVLWDKLRERSVFLASGVPVVTTTKKKLTWPTLTKDIEVQFVGEGETIPESDPEFGELVAEPKAIKALARATSEAIEDSEPNLREIVFSNMLTKMAQKFDAEALVGGSTHGFNGLAKTANIQTLDVNYEALDSYDILVAAVGMLAAKNVPGPYVCAVHPYVATALARLKETHDGAESNLLLPAPDGLPEFLPTPAVGLTAAKESKPQFSTMLVYAPNSIRAVNRLDGLVELDRSEEFDSDKVAMRGKTRGTIVVPYPEAVVRIDHVPAPTITA